METNASADMTQRRGRLVESVREGARLDSSEEAEEMIRAVTGAMVDHFPPEASAVIAEVIPSHLVGEGSSGEPREAASADALFEDVGQRRELGTATAARYARVVAESISREMSGADLDRLDDLLADEFLALFEVDHRGELTEDDGSTPGARIVGAADSEEETPR